ncbi:MAG: photosystem II stability/assembly factor-like uncharacterized protein, partial [Thalassolituus oleivorans]
MPHVVSFTPNSTCSLWPGPSNRRSGGLCATITSCSLFLALLISLVAQDSSAQRRMDLEKTFESTTDAWVRTDGPGGGVIVDIAIDPSNPDVMAASGSPEGLFISDNAGSDWSLVPNPGQFQGAELEFDPHGSGVLYATLSGGLSRSLDGGRSWQSLLPPQFGGLVIAFHQSTASRLFAAVHTEAGIEVLRSSDGGDTWTTATGDLSTPASSRVSDLEVQLDGSVLIAINDINLAEWGNGQVFITKDDGLSWTPVSFGSIEPRFVFGLLVHPTRAGELWLSEGTLFNSSPSSPVLFKSSDYGETWLPVSLSNVDLTQVRPVAAGSDGRVFVGAGRFLVVTSDGGETFQNITPTGPEFLIGDIHRLSIVPSDPAKLYLPLRGSGIGYSADSGISWTTSHRGIASTSMNLLAVDPANPARLYAASSSGEGVFRADQFGDLWERVPGRLAHQWMDEITTDPSNSDRIWTVSDVPYISVSDDRGDSWRLLQSPYQPGDHSFSAPYAIALTDGGRSYAVNNGFGIFRSEEQNGAWTVCRTSEIDYSYALAVSESNPDVLYSGYNRKPFEESAMVRATSDGCTTWHTVLDVDGASAVTAVALERDNDSRVWAAAVGEIGASIWRSRDAGSTWSQPNGHFNMTNIHAYAVSTDNPQLAYAAAWGGGTYVTRDGGANWQNLPGDAFRSVASIVIDPDDSQTVFFGDRLSPRVYRSTDGGATAEVFFDAGPDHRRIMAVELDPNSDRVWVSTMAAFGRGGPVTGDLFTLSPGTAPVVAQGVTRTLINLTVDPTDQGALYGVGHERGVFRSSDFGATWTRIDIQGSGLPDAGFFDLAAGPGGTLYLVGGSDVRFDTVESAGIDPAEFQTVYLSSDGGTTWLNLNDGTFGENSGFVKSIEVLDESELQLLAAAENGLFLSSDGGTSWTADSLLPYETLAGVATSGEQIYAFTHGAGVFSGSISSSLVTTWEGESALAIPINFSDLKLDPSNEDVIYVTGYPGGVFKSVDGGTTWKERNFGMISFPVDDPLRQGYYAIDISRTAPEVLHLALYGRGLYRSENGADTWFQVNGPDREMAGRLYSSVRIDPRDEDVVYVGTSEGVFTTQDGGQTWSRELADFGNGDVRTIAASPSGRLAVGTKGAGIYYQEGAGWNAGPTFDGWGVNWPVWGDRPMYQYTSMLIH